jgi:hypothetical protein
MRLTWRKQPSESGLASTCQSPRGLVCKVDGEDVARVYAHPVGYHKYNGWFWVAVGDTHKIPLHNSCKTPVQDMLEAKRQATEYVRRYLKGQAKS